MGYWSNYERLVQEKANASELFSALQEEDGDHIHLQEILFGWLRLPRNQQVLYAVKV